MRRMADHRRKRHAERRRRRHTFSASGNGQFLQQNMAFMLAFLKDKKDRRIPTRRILRRLTKWQAGWAAR